MQQRSRWGAVFVVLSVARVAAADPVAPPPTGSGGPRATSAPATGTDATPPRGVVAPPPNVALPEDDTADAPPSQEPPAPTGPEPRLQAPHVPVDPYSEPVPVWFQGDDGERAVISLYPEFATVGSGAPLASCRLPCGFQMQRGRYRVAVAETESTLPGSRPVSIDGPSRLTITPRDRAKRTTGLILGIGGAVAVVAGIGLMADGLGRAFRFCDSSTNCDSGNGAEFGGGLLLFVAGAALTPIGWVMFGKSFRPAIDVEHAMQASGPRGTLGLVGVPGGAGLGGTFVF